MLPADNLLNGKFGRVVTVSIWLMFLGSQSSEISVVSVTLCIIMSVALKFHMEGKLVVIFKNPGSDLYLTFVGSSFYQTKFTLKPQSNFRIFG